MDKEQTADLCKICNNIILKHVSSVKYLLLYFVVSHLLISLNYQPNCHVMYIAYGWFAAKFCLADKFAKQYFLLSSSVKLGPDSTVVLQAEEACEEMTMK